MSYDCQITSCPVTYFLHYLGKFTNAQRILYEALLEIQEACVQQCVIGSTLQDNYNNMLGLLARQLHKIGVTPKKYQSVSTASVS